MRIVPIEVTSTEIYKVDLEVPDDIISEHDLSYYITNFVAEGSWARGKHETTDNDWDYRDYYADVGGKYASED